jgi:hypothetical protein
MQTNQYTEIKTNVVKEFEASQDLLAFMAFNLKEKVVINRLYSDNSESKSLILVHFSFRGLDWLLQRNIVANTWQVKEKGVMLFTTYTKADIINARFV